MSEVTVCNMALSHISQAASVTSIRPPDGTANAQHCAMFFDIARDAVLERHTWSFATFRVALAQVSNPRDNWGFAYALPPETLRAVALLAPGSRDDSDSQEHVIEMSNDGTKILYTNVENATLKYIKRVADTGKWNTSFTFAFSWLLAHLIAGPITKKPAVVESTLKLYEGTYLPLAKSLDAEGQQFNPIKNHVPDHIAARGVGGIPDARIVR